MSESNKPQESSEEFDLDARTFDVKFQAALLKLALKDDYFCAQLVRYLGQDEDLKGPSVFAIKEYHFIFTLIVKSVDEYKTRPDEAQLRTEFQAFEESKREPYIYALDQILSTDIHNEEYYRKQITAFVVFAKTKKLMKESRVLFAEKPGDAPDYMQKKLDQLKRVKFEKEDVLSLESVYSLVKKDTDRGNKIPTGLKRLDDDLGGGFPRETLVTVLAGSNAGKSIFCNSLGCNALRKKFKVLHINLEGTRDEVVFRYLSNLADVEFKKLEEDTLNTFEREKVAKAVKDHNENLKIRNMLNFGMTIEEVIAYCRECYKVFPFDMIVVDYGQLLKTKQKGVDKGFDRQTEAYRGLDSLSKEFNCVVVSPAQSTREGMKKQNDHGKGGYGRSGKDDPMPVLRSADLADCIEIARVSAIILTLNRTEDEEVRGWVRVFLEKQRRGRKAITYGVKAKYANSNLIINDYYEPHGLVHKLADDKDEVEKNDAETSLSQTTESKPATFSTELSLKDAVAASNSQNPEEQKYNEIMLEFEKLVNEKEKIDQNFGQNKDMNEVQALTKRLILIRDRRKAIKSEAKQNIAKIHPTANKELYILAKQSLFEKNKDNPGTPEVQAKERLYIKQLELAFED